MVLLCDCSGFAVALLFEYCNIAVCSPLSHCVNPVWYCGFAGGLVADEPGIDVVFKIGAGHLWHCRMFEAV